jgi:hypothetical protein
MGITAVLEMMDGSALESVEDPTNVLHRILPEAGDPKYACLSRIDWYGDTVFNYLQAPLLLAEWRTLESGDLERDAETKRVVHGVQRLAERLAEERHIYLRFYGD